MRFDAGFIAGLIAGEDAAGCLRWGSAVGASCVRSISATDKRLYPGGGPRPSCKQTRLQVEVF